MVWGESARPGEESAVEEFLTAAAREPSALLIEGEPGIGKTTLWSAALEAARARDFTVLSTGATAAESVPAYTALAELLAAVDPVVWSEFPEPQRKAINQILSRSRHPGAATDQRAVAAAFLSVVERLVDDGPVLLAVDDLQWLEPSSAHVLSYTARRLSGPVGMIGTVRTEDNTADAADRLQMLRPEAVQRITLWPLTSHALHTVIAQHVDRPISKADISRIHQISGGNPFYAIELARAFDGTVETFLPSSLSELVRNRIVGLDPAVLDALLAAASVATPTVELVAAAVGVDHDRAVELLEDAEHHDIVVIEGNRIRLTHPLLATGVYTNASADDRRRIHRRLADVEDATESRARHLALAAEPGDAHALQALDDAAAVAHARGAPAAAAELLELAIALGGDTHARRIRLAMHCFDGGDPGRARALLERCVAAMDPGPERAEAVYSLAIVRFMDDGYVEASELLRRTLTDDDPDTVTRIRIVTALAHALYNVGDAEAAVDRAEEAVELAESLGATGLLSPALGVRAMLRYLTGMGIDEPSLHRAESLEDLELPTPTLLQPRVLHAMQLGWLGDLDEGYDRLLSIQRQLTELGRDGDVIFIDYQLAMNRVWRGAFADAARIADATVELARRLGGEFAMMLALVLKASVAVYTGPEDQARAEIAAATAASRQCGTAWHNEWCRSLQGFLDVSLGRYDDALHILKPLLTGFAENPGIAEVFAAAFVPDAVEALVDVGRVGEAEQLADALEQNGNRLNRAWMLAVGARCRAMVLAASGDLDAAVAAARQAMVHHDRIPMPFDRARSLLLLGQLQHRQRDHGATTTIRTALDAFEQLGAPLWADRARAYLTDADVRRSGQSTLTDTERRVAELAAAGKSNREIADVLFVSPKTVEATLARVYRKLDIGSRAELRRSLTDDLGKTTTQRV